MAARSLTPHTRPHSQCEVFKLNGFAGATRASSARVNKLRLCDGMACHSLSQVRRTNRFMQIPMPCRWAQVPSNRQMQEMLRNLSKTKANIVFPLETHVCIACWCCCSFFICSSLLGKMVDANCEWTMRKKRRIPEANRNYNTCDETTLHPTLSPSLHAFHCHWQKKIEITRVASTSIEFRRNHQDHLYLYWIAVS